MPWKAKKPSSGKARKHVLEKRFDDFGKEVGALGNKLGRKMDCKDEEWDSWFHRSFGLVGPLISSIFGILIFTLAIWAIGLVNSLAGSTFLVAMQRFMSTNIAEFFLIFMFFSYASYLSRSSPKGYDSVSPFFSAVGVTIGFWVIGEVLAIANVSIGIALLANVVTFINANLFWIFMALLVIGYVFWGIKRASGCPFHERENLAKKVDVMKNRALGKGAPSGKVRRLYRSGSDKILGGVCGGIAEYLGVDPVLIRLLWVIGTFAWGFGILAYIIAWIIIPRDPGHKWDD